MKPNMKMFDSMKKNTDYWQKITNFALQYPIL